MAGEEAENKMLFCRSGQSARGFDSGFDLGEHGARVIEKNVAGGSEFDAANSAREKARPDFIFEIANLATERRLGGVQAFTRRERQAFCLGDRNEVAKMSQLHVECLAALCIVSPCLKGMA